MRVLAPLALAVLVLLAGCSDGGSTPPEEQQIEEKFEELDLKATSTTGVIRGLVVDDAIRPVPGAKVTVTGIEQAETTDENGLFGFEDLEAGTYFLQVSKNGFRPTQQSAEVVAGVADPEVVKVLLQVDASTLAYVEAHQYEGYIQCGFLLANFVFDAESCDPEGATGLSANDDSAPWFAVTRQPQYYQSEMTWEATQEFSHNLGTIQWACNEGECGDDDYRLCNVWGPAPIICRVTMDGGGGMTDSTGAELGGGVGITEAEFGTENLGYQVAMFADCYQQCVPGTAVGLGISIEQKFQVFNFLFYGYEPPADWSFLANGPPPPPPA